MTKMNFATERKRMRAVARYALQLAFASALVLYSVTPALARLACIAGNVTLNYGSYDVLAGTVLDAAGTITVTCTKSGTNANTNGNVTYEVALTPLPPRQLAPPSGGDRLSHQFYTDSARTKPWGDGTGGTFIITSTFFVGRNSTATDVPDNFYARITPGGQDVSAASPGPPPTTYTQNFTVTVTCTSPARNC
jgi:spore coat protein U-like protein